MYKAFCKNILSQRPCRLTEAFVSHCGDAERPSQTLCQMRSAKDDFSYLAQADQKGPKDERASQLRLVPVALADNLCL